MDEKYYPTGGGSGNYPVELKDLGPVAMRYRISVTQAYELLKHYDHDRAALDRAVAALKARERG